jgi:hypothetical protein
MKRLNLLSSLKALFVAAILFFSLTMNTAFGQNAVSDEDLRKYAVVMTTIDDLKATLQTDYNTLIKNEPAMAGGKRFLEIEKAGGDEEKLKEIEATEEELVIYSKIKEEYEKMTGDFKENYTRLIKEDLGAGLYNSITKELKSSKDLKEKYQSIVAEIQASKEAEDEDKASVE